MGFWTDLGNIAVGAIDRDRENTAAKFKNRADELKANRDLNIAMKKDKYAADLKSYNEERNKANEIKKLNAEAPGLSHTTYAKRYMLHTLGADNFNALQKSDPEGFLDMVNNFAEKVQNQGTLSYKSTIDRDVLDNKFKADTTLINKAYSKELENARGDSFLIKKIIGEKNNVTSNVDNEIATSTEKTKEISNNIDNEDNNVGLNVTVDGTKSLRKPTKEYETEFSKVQNNSRFDSINKKDNLFDFIDASKTLGFSKEVNGFKFDEKDQKVTGLTDGGVSFLNTYKTAYNDIVSSYNATNMYNFDSKRKSDIANFLNPQKINNQLKNILVLRSDKITTGDEGFTSPFKSNKDVITMIPLKVVDMNNQATINGKAVNIDIMQSKKVYNNFLETQAQTLFGSNEGEQGNANIRKVQGLIEGGNEALIKALKNELVLKDTEGAKVNTDVKTKPKEKSTTIAKPNFVVLPDGTAFSDGNKKYTFENIKKNKEQDKLPPNIKSAYDIWNQGQNAPDAVKTEKPFKSPFASTAPIGPIK